jgi:hypothetical protein
MELPVVNHKDYEAQLNDDNKFPIKKFGELAKALIKNKITRLNLNILLILTFKNPYYRKTNKSKNKTRCS